MYGTVSIAQHWNGPCVYQMLTLHFITLGKVTLALKEKKKKLIFFRNAN